ncbi:MAG: hypothetical protein KDK30_19000, partial [Leptospiraceae bacterium]|nr:hypothetical protein [Leptospiraceae bacterium]
MLDYIFRLFPHRANTGLFPLGKPDADAPVIVTGNYHLTVKRLRRVLKYNNVWLLVIDSHGINVWCAAAGGHMTH